MRQMVVIGLGETGWSVIRRYHKAYAIKVMDQAPYPRYAEAARQCLGADHVLCGALDASWCVQADVVVFSPGFSVLDPFYRTLQQQNRPLRSDVDLFFDQVVTPVIGVTGTNGKSTLVTLLAHVARAMGEQVFEGGNLGTPCLDGLTQHASLHILELSSFQLAHAQSLPLDVAILLNLADDHASWHGHIDHYHQSKLKILTHAKQGWVVGDMANRVWSAHTQGKENAHIHRLPNASSWQHIAQQGWAVDTTRLPFGLDASLVAVTLAIAKTRGWPVEKVVQSLYDFKGLPHRLEVVGRFAEVLWINDSKATNADAVLYACRRLAPTYHQRVVLLLAGKPKGWTQEALLPYQGLLKALVVVGAHASDFPQALPGLCYHRCETVAEAAHWAYHHAQSGDCILFSPGGASFDQFRHFSERGDCFKNCVHELCGD